MKRTIALLSILILMIFSYGMAEAASPPTVNVNVTNTPTNPVPVTGNLGITGTPNVNVTNTPNVNITNTSISVAPQTTTTLLPPTAYKESVTLTLDTSKCSKVRVQAYNYNCGQSGPMILISDSALGQIDFINNFCEGRGIVVDIPPPSLRIDTFGSSLDYSLGVYCR